MCVAGHQNFGCKELEECGIKWGRMADNSEEGQGPQRAVEPMMMMMMNYKLTFSNTVHTRVPESNSSVSYTFLVVVVEHSLFRC
jgi:hypothetical protein